jgi:Uma2 family endonuclease
LGQRKGVCQIIVECTFWDDVEQKSRGLQLKIDDYLELGFELVLIVTTGKYLEKYLKLLAASNVMVITADHLSDLLDGKNGRVKRVN